MTAPEYILAGCAALGVLANWGTNRFYYGKLTQTVTTTSDAVIDCAVKWKTMRAHVAMMSGLRPQNSKANGHAAGRSH
jgi:hypothetical protein